MASQTQRRSQSPDSASHEEEKPAQTPRIDTVSVDSASTDGPQPQLHAKTFLAVLSVCVIYFVQIYNVVGAGALTNTITLSLPPTTTSSVWLATSIAAATAILSPILSQAATVFGRRWFLVVPTLLGAAGSLVIARADSMDMAIAGFAVTGASYAAQPLLHAVSSEVVPRRYRSWGQAADLIANALGGITALLVSGGVVRTANVGDDGWRNFWYVGTGLYGLAGVLCAVLYRPLPREAGGGVGERLGRLDWGGYGLWAAGVLLFCVGLAWGGNPFPWSDPHTSATFAVGVFALVLLAGYEVFGKKDGMFHHGLFGHRNFAIALVCLFCEGVAFFGANSYFAFQVGVLYEADALLVGVRYSVTMFVSIFSAAVAGAYCAATKKVRWIAVTSFLFFVVFFACMASTDLTTNAHTWGYPVFLGIALGLSLVTLITLAQLSTPPELIAITSGLVIGIRSLGGSVGLAIYNALFTGAMSHVGDNIAAAVVPLGLPLSSLGPFIGALTAHDNESLFQIPGVTPQIVGAGADALLATFSTGFKHVWITAACFVAFAAIVAVFIEDPSKEFNMHIDAPLEKDEELYSPRV
ncbi:major facilitator superfamily domain-containing protein [Lasiosphaeria hispida]|uniref:Major facilitator superfamily domain-containing protein n=1 Tax=Lasiosphaeria hispida TaxID=260671 RepID=A0AAJ0MIQ4_9PEZI|nr:major facilitator superfamily domain-containing protein [Lasiosphaeria hispida]